MDQKNCMNRNRMVRYLAVSIHTLGPVHLRKGLLAVKVVVFASSM